MSKESMINMSVENNEPQDLSEKAHLVFDLVSRTLYSSIVPSTTEKIG